MATRKRSDIPDVPFRPAKGRDVAVEVIEMSVLEERRRRVVDDGVPERLTFEYLLLVWGGSGCHVVDFQEIDLRPGRVVRVRPGQVQQWNAATTLDAVAIIARDVSAQRWLAGDPAFCDLDADLLDVSRHLVHALAMVQDRPNGSRLAAQLWQSLVDVYELGTSVDRRDLPEPYVAFCEAIEASPGASHNVADIAAGLAWSERTIRRACLDVTGLTPKQLLNQRLMLEAKRLLAHTDRSAASIAAELRFSEATNFQKFFQRLAGENPGDFRRSVRAVG